MRVRYFLVAVACALCLLALPRPTVPAEPQVSAAPIDFDALHAEARGALEALRQSAEPRVASTANATF